MPLAEAITQLSFLEFLQRCNLSVAPPQPPQLPVPISLLDSAVQTTPPSYPSQDVSTQTSDQPDSLLSFDVAVQTPFHSVHTSSLDAAVQTLPHSPQAVSTQMGSRPASSFSIGVTVQTLVRNTVYTTLPHNYRSRSSLLAVSFRTILLIVRARHWHKVISVVSHCLHFPTLLRLAPSAVPALTVTIMSALWLHVSCSRQHRVSNNLPRLQVSLLMPTCAPHMAHLLIRYCCDPYAQLSQSRPHSLLLVPSMWEHTLCAQPLPAREVPVLPWREHTILPIQILIQGQALFINRVPSFFLWSTLVNPNLLGTVILVQPTVTLCIINFAFPS